MTHASRHRVGSTEPQPVPVRLQDIGPEWLAAVPVAERPLAGRVAVASRLHLPAGAWTADALAYEGSGTPYAAVLLHGVVIRDIVLPGVASAGLFGPGDILKLWGHAETSLHDHMRWSCANDETVVAVLDDRMRRVTATWPGVGHVLRQRLADQLDSAELHRAIVSMPRAEQRIFALMWMFADRWGTVTPDGVVVALNLKHELIGRLVGARRPTVSLALRALIDDGLLTRTADHRWRLPLGSDAAIGAPAVTAVAG